MINMTQGWCFAGPPRSGFGRWQPSEALYLRCFNIIATGVGAVKVLLDHKDADCGQFRFACAQACPFHGLRLAGHGLQSRRWARALPATAIAREQAVFPPKPLGAGYHPYEAPRHRSVAARAAREWQGAYGSIPHWSLVRWASTAHAHHRVLAGTARSRIERPSRTLPGEQVRR